MLTTTTVIGMIYKPDGQPAAGAVVNVDLNRPDTDSATGIVVPAKLSFIAAADGRVEMPLWPNSRGITGSQYVVVAGAGNYFRATITVPEAEFANLKDIISLPPYPTKSASQVALEEAQAAIAETFTHVVGHPCRPSADRY